MKQKFSATYIYLASVLALALDQFAKLIAIKKIPESGIFLFDFSFLSIKLELLKNSALAFGLDLPQTIIFSLTLSIIFILLILFFKLIKLKAFLTSLFFGIIIFSAISNLFDRIFHGGVIDFISIKFFNWPWPTFNLADAFITISVIGLIFGIMGISKTKYQRSNIESQI